LFLLTVELRVADYWAVTRLFEEMSEQIRQEIDEFDWEQVTQTINKNSKSLQYKYSRTIAAFGVEVSISFSKVDLTIGMVVVRDEHPIINAGQDRVER
jgi:hypothetical protein